MNGLFGLNGLTGFAIAVVLLLAVVAGLGTLAIITQSNEALTPYKVEQSSSIRMNGGDMNKYYKVQ